MINKLIDKYKAKLKYITDLKNKTSFELVRVSCSEKEFIVKEIIKDLEELKEQVRKELYGQDMTIAEYKGACRRLGVDIDDK